MSVYLFPYSIAHSLSLPTHCTVLAKTYLLALNFKTMFLCKRVPVYSSLTHSEPLSPRDLHTAWATVSQIGESMKNKNPKLWHIEISRSTYSFHLSRLTHIINMASYQSCLQFLCLMMHSSLFLQQLSCTHWNALQNISEVKVR